jgi:hypothetical protein
LLDLLRHFEGALDVPALRGFGAPAEQDDDGVAALDEIDPIAGSEVDAHFADPVEELHVAQQPGFETNDPLAIFRAAANVLEAPEPVGEHGGLADVDHV